VAQIINGIRLLHVTKLIYTSHIFLQERYLDLVETIYRRGNVTQARVEFGDGHREFITKNTEQNLERKVDFVRVNGALLVLMTYHAAWVSDKIRNACRKEK